MSAVKASQPDRAAATIDAALLVKSSSRSGTGVTVAARSLAQALVAGGGVNLDVLAIDDPYSAEDAGQWAPLRPEVFPSYGPQAIRYAPALYRRLADLDVDLVHTHALWVYTSMAASKWTGRTGRPLVVSPHGMLDPWAVQNSRWKKRLAGWLYENGHLRRAHCLHALCQSEAESIRAFGLTNPIAIIPNGINLPSDSRTSQVAWSDLVPEGERVVLFLSRIHPKKNLPGLLRGFHQVDRREGWHLAIAGMDEGGHEQTLKQLAAELGLQAHIHFIGPQYGAAKAAAYEQADAFVLPSISEGLPMVVLEAWAYRLPALLTPQCNLPIGASTGAAIEVGTDPAAIAQGLTTLFAMSDKDRVAMGQAGRSLVEQQFTWQHVAAQMRDVYAWLLGGAEPQSIWTS